MNLDARPRFRHEFLPSLVDPSHRLNHSTPSLRPNYRASSLLRVDPPLCHASGLLSSWVFHLGISLGIVTTGSHVPHESLNRARATFTPVTIKAVSRSRLDRIPGQRLEPGFDDVHTLSTPHQWFTRVRLLGSYLTGAVRLITSILMLPELTSSGHQCESELFRVSGVAPDSPERPSR